MKNLHIPTVMLLMALLILSWTAQGKAEAMATTGATDELPQALFILPWQHRGQTLQVNQRWLDDAPHGRLRTVDEHELGRQVNYHAILGRSAAVRADDRNTVSQEE